jgi:xylose isomerase
MDHMAIAFKKAAAILENDFIANKLFQRYEGWGQHFGQSILNGQQNLESLASHTVSNSLQPKHVNGQQKMMENKVNRVLFV